jgi:hypothetical protein
MTFYVLYTRARILLVRFSQVTTDNLNANIEKLFWQINTQVTAMFTLS